MQGRDPRQLQAPPRAPTIPPRVPQQRGRMADRPGRDPQRPYIDNHGSLASLAKHLHTGLDFSKPKTEVDTHVLAELLEHVIAVGFGPQAVAQIAAEREAALKAAFSAAQEGMIARLKQADDDGGNDGSGNRG